MKTRKIDYAAADTGAATISPNLEVSELVTYLHISRSQAYRLVNDPSFPSFRIGTKILTNRDHLDEWISEQESRFCKDKAATARRR